MNYFGHAAIASQRDEGPAFVLGSMLPDLCAMVGMDCPRGNNGDLNAGIEFHLSTDSLFHQTEMFTSHNRRALAELRTLGISRGPARACAHMGVEMLIDAVLAEQHEYLEAYREALLFGAKELSLLNGGTIHLSLSLAQRIKLKALLAFLAEKGAWVFESSYLRLRDRLHGALSNRSRLCPSEQELAHIATWLEQDRFVRPDVTFLLHELRFLKNQVFLAPVAVRDVTSRTEDCGTQNHRQGD
jgi:hypothetical protein